MAVASKGGQTGDVGLSARDAGRMERIAWGGSSALVGDIRRLGFDRWLDGQLRPGPAVFPAAVRSRLDAMESTRVPLEERVRALDEKKRGIYRVSGEEEKRAAQKAYRQDLNAQGKEAASKSLLLALHSPNQLEEQMTWFWMNHFSVGAGKQNIQAWIGDYESGLRAKSLTRFRDVLDASVFHPAMLRYLDNERNAAGHVNENYARELLELHTLGVDGGYTQQDVQELAKVLTGLGIAGDDSAMVARRRPLDDAGIWRQGSVVFRPSRHEGGERMLLGQRVAAGGLDGIREVLDRLARHPSTARHVGRRLAVFFVTDTPSDALVEALKHRYLATDGDIPAVLRTLFASSEFEASLGRKFKDPQHFVVSAVRIAYDGAPVVDAGPMLDWLRRLGQSPYGRQTPDGWPLGEAEWASAGQMNVRFEVARAVGEGRRALLRDTERAASAPPPDVSPQVDNSVWRTAFAPRLSQPTRDVLAEAREHEASPADWNALALSSPEFMRR